MAQRSAQSAAGSVRRTTEAGGRSGSATALQRLEGRAAEGRSVRRRVTVSGDGRQQRTAQHRPAAMHVFDAPVVGPSTAVQTPVPTTHGWSCAAVRRSVGCGSMIVAPSHEGDAPATRHPLHAATIRTNEGRTFHSTPLCSTPLVPLRIHFMGDPYFSLWRPAGCKATIKQNGADLEFVAKKRKGT